MGALSIYSTIGILLRFCVASTDVVVLTRSLIGALVVGAALLIRGGDWKALKGKTLTVIISGIVLCANWIFLFEGYSHVVSVASLCNYTAPLIFLVCAAVFFKERITLKQCIFVGLAAAGVVLVSGLTETDGSGAGQAAIYGIAAALCFVGILFCNRKLADIQPLVKTFVQLICAAAATAVYMLVKSIVTGSNAFAGIADYDTVSIIILVILGIVHTGFAYIFYF